MPRYRVTARSFINGNLEPPGAEVSYDGIPGSHLEPLDDEAHAAKEAAAAIERRPGMRSVDGKRPVEPPVGRAPLPVQKPRELVEIPENWRDMRAEQRINLARKLGAPVKGTTVLRADETIETEIARRATV